MIERNRKLAYVLTDLDRAEWLFHSGNRAEALVLAQKCITEISKILESSLPQKDTIKAIRAFRAAIRMLIPSPNSIPPTLDKDSSLPIDMIEENRPSFLDKSKARDILIERFTEITGVRYNTLPEAYTALKNSGYGECDKLKIDRLIRESWFYYERPDLDPLSRTPGHYRIFFAWLFEREEDMDRFIEAKNEKRARRQIRKATQPFVRKS